MIRFVFVAIPVYSKTLYGVFYQRTNKNIHLFRLRKINNNFSLKLLFDKKLSSMFITFKSTIIARALFGNPAAGAEILHLVSHKVWRVEEFSWRPLMTISLTSGSQEQLLQNEIRQHCYKKRSQECHINMCTWCLCRLKCFVDTQQTYLYFNVEVSKAMVSHEDVLLKHIFLMSSFGLRHIYCFGCVTEVVGWVSGEWGGRVLRGHVTWKIQL